MKKRDISFFISNHWFALYSACFSFVVLLPFLAPVLMKLGLDGGAKTIYSLYSILCHQLPQRSFFFYGDKIMHSLSEIQIAWQTTNNPLILRGFIGNSQMGWKVAWSDRMISMYISVLLFSWIWYPFRKKIKGISTGVFILFLLPLVIDGTSHLVSELLNGIGNGFRDSNIWLAELTNFRFSPTFYAGDALGSFNSWARFLTGISFGIGVVFFVFPIINEIYAENLERFNAKLRELEILQEKGFKDINDFKLSHQRSEILKEK